MLHHLCCKTDGHTIPPLDCVKGDCTFAKCFSDKVSQILNGGGCCTLLDIDDDELIDFYVLGTFRVKEQSKKCKARTTMRWTEFKQKCTESLEEHLYYRYINEWQELQRELITHKISNTITLPENALFTSFDYGGNIHCGTLFELSMMVGFEVTNIAGQLQETNVCILSHGWYSAVPSYKKSNDSNYNNRY